MSTATEKEADSKPQTDRFGELEARQTALERKMKGYAGQIGEIRALAGVPRPGTARNASESPNLSPTEAVKSSVTEVLGQPEASKQASHHESLFPFMESCPGCGEHNPAFEPPKVRCKGCGVPLSSSDKPEDVDKIKSCWNCKGERTATGELIVTTRSPKGIVW